MFNRTIVVLCAATAIAGFLSATDEPQEKKVQGVLIDRMCSAKAETRIGPGPRIDGGIVVAYTHTKQCALMPECQKSGYGVFTYDDQKFLPFDAAGNQKALAYFNQSKQDSDFRVEVTGKIRGDVMQVTSIKALP